MMPTKLAATAIGVKNLGTEKLLPNPHNPRALFDREDMDVLRESIKRVGILVPLTVYQESKTKHYRILDGQRRWMCAKDLKLASVPVNEVAEPTLVQNIVTMFQIHKLRKDWELMPTALKLELLMDQLKEKRERVLAELTGLDEAVVTRCRKLLSYPRKYQDMMLDPEPERRLKADFFIELYAVRNDRAVNKFEWFRRNRFTDAMLRKFQVGGLKAVTDFRIVKQHINNAVKAHKVGTISKRLREFADNPELTPDHLSVESALAASEARKLGKTVDKLYEQVKAIDVDEFYGQDEFWGKLQRLASLIRTRLRELGRRVDE
jgi:ParB/RepB/Spo0J family partition protein